MKLFLGVCLLINSLAYCRARCPEGWHYFENNCYFFETTLTKTTEIEGKCTALGASLVMVKTEAQFHFLSNLITNHGFLLGTVTVGPKQYLWRDGTPIAVGEWAPTYPKCTESCCIVALRHSGKFYDYTCSDTELQLCSKPSENPIITEVASGASPEPTSGQDVATSSDQCSEGWIRFEDTCYYFNKTWTKMTEIEAKCTSLGASRVQIKSEAQLQFLVRSNMLFANLGTKRVGPTGYQWLDGSPINVGAWYPGKPDCTNSCCDVFLVNEGKLFDVSCGPHSYQLCSKTAGGSNRTGIASNLRPLEQDMRQSLSQLKSQVDGMETKLISRMNDMETGLKTQFRGSLTKVESKLDKVLSRLFTR